ncbi:hypothetical protein MPTK2_3g24280 [Marchantia polymorpha subsp. ruderalis]
MESASVSILIDVAELATEGMDSADEEPELRSAVQDLIQRLERIEFRSAGLERPERLEEMVARWYSSVRVEERVESAGASIVRDVAELATGGMDSAHEEPEGSSRYWSAGSSLRGMDSAHEEPEGSCRYWSAGSSFRGMDSAHEEQEGSSRYWSAGSSSGGMDSAHEEPEGSSRYSAVQDIIGCLEGKGKPITELPCLSRQEFRDFFPDRASISTISGWRSKVRREVLESIGSCNTFHYLDVNDIFGGDISRLEAKEWKVLLRGFSCSTVLRAIRVEGLRWKSIAEVESLESLCLQLGGILRTSSVTDLTIGNCRLSARCFLNLASGLGGNDESKLKTLELHNAWKDSDAVKPIADMINSATRLETLEIGGSPDDRMYDMDEEAARILSRALIQSSSLKKLVLREVEGETSAFLLKALHGDGSNRSIQCLHLISVSGLGDSLRELLTSNPYLKEVTLAAIHMRPEEWRRLGQAIRENATARSIRVFQKMHHKDHLKGVEELACAASSDVMYPKVELIITVDHYDALVSALIFVGKVLRGNITSLESLILFLNCSCPPGSNPNGMGSILPMDENLRDTTVLKRLRLFVQEKETLKVVWKCLLECLRDNTSVTQLDLSDSELDDEAFGDLMGLLQVNLTLKEINFSRTSWETDGKAAQVQEALEQNQKRAQLLQQARPPRITYVTNNVGTFYKMSAGLHSGRMVRLHMMCESLTGFHRVKDQKGLKICLENNLENNSWILKAVEFSYKVMYYAAKHSTSKVIPDWADLIYDIVILDGLSDLNRRADLKGGDSRELSEVRLRIEQTLEPHLKDRYSFLFKLYKVKYVGLELGGHAWVCKKCMCEGLRSGILTC